MAKAERNLELEVRGKVVTIEEMKILARKHLADVGNCLLNTAKIAMREEKEAKNKHVIGNDLG